MLLISLLFVCHFLGDFTPLSTTWMQEAKQFGKPLFPILIHALIHASLMLFVLFFFTTVQMAFTLSAFQLIIHFFVDTWKGRMNTWFPSLQNNANKEYWIIFGFDQFLHQMTILVMAFYL